MRFNVDAKPFVATSPVVASPTRDLTSNWSRTNPPPTFGSWANPTDALQQQQHQQPFVSSALPGQGRDPMSMNDAFNPIIGSGSPNSTMNNNINNQSVISPIRHNTALFISTNNSDAPNGPSFQHHGADYQHILSPSVASSALDADTVPFRSAPIYLQPRDQSMTTPSPVLRGTMARSTPQTYQTAGGLPSPIIINSPVAASPGQNVFRSPWNDPTGLPFSPGMMEHHHHQQRAFDSPAPIGRPPAFGAMSPTSWSSPMHQDTSAYQRDQSMTRPYSNIRSNMPVIGSPTMMRGMGPGSFNNEPSANSWSVIPRPELPTMWSSMAGVDRGGIKFNLDSTPTQVSPNMNNQFPFKQYQKW